MTFLSQPLGFTQAEFKTYVAGLKWRQWKPQFVTLHNSAKPNLKDWAHSGLGKVAGLQRVKNLNHYYQSEEGWHSGPHLFIAPDLIWVACELTADGVHASCYNKVSIGVEMVGDYATEAFDSGDGAKVRDNTVAALAILHQALGIGPDTLHFHKECLHDHHDCPGAHVSKPDMIARIKAAKAAPKPMPSTPALAGHVAAVTKGGA
jgi:hypothetical protein